MKTTRTPTPATLAASITTSLQKARTLLADGYQFLTMAKPFFFAVLKPNESGLSCDEREPAYIIRVWADHTLDRRTGEIVTIWRYHCSCPLFAEQERHQAAYDQTWAYVSEVLGLDCPCCKHGAALVAEITRAHALVAHTMPVPIEGNVIWDLPADKPKPRAADPSHPWPTRRANYNNGPSKPGFD